MFLGEAWELSTNTIEWAGGFLITMMGWYLKRQMNSLQLRLEDVQFAGQQPVKLPKDPKEELRQLEMDSPV